MMDAQTTICAKSCLGNCMNWVRVVYLFYEIKKAMRLFFSCVTINATVKLFWL